MSAITKIVNGVVTEMSQAEIDIFNSEQISVGVPGVVTMRQARLALFEQGVLSQVGAALNSIPDEAERTKAQIEWEYATVVERNAALTQSLGAAMGLNKSQLDDLFRLAVTL